MRRSSIYLLTTACLLAHLTIPASAQGENQDANYAVRFKENVLDQAGSFQPVAFKSASLGKYPWKHGIVTTVFWIGESPTSGNPVPNHASSWDKYWARNYGGFDNPKPQYRRNYIPVGFLPRQNPFYVALPYNDVTRGTTKPEAARAIPWFQKTFERAGKTVCKGRWLAIRKGDRICYAQWEDCGPFRTDHWQYVFGNERPRRNLNNGAGLDVSPAIRDYLGLGGTDVTDWKFVDFEEIPKGPWSIYGENNTFVQNRRKHTDVIVRNAIAGKVAADFIPY